MPGVGTEAPRKVLHMATRFLRGGSERDMADAIGALPEEEYESWLLIGPEHDKRAIEELLPEHCRVVVEPSLVREISPSQDARAMLSIRSFIQGRKFDVVHTCQSKVGVLGRLAASMAGTPLILHRLTMANFFESRQVAVTSAFRGAEQLVARWTDAYFVVGTDLMQRYLRAGIAEARRFHVVRSAIDLERFEAARNLDRQEARRRLSLPPDENIVAYIGALEERKGVGQLPAYLESLRAIAPGGLRLVIAGDGPLRDCLERDFARRGLSAAVTFLGFTREVPAAMAAADCVVLLSEAEGLPQVLVQAAAVGRPFVAYPVDGPRELLRKGATGSIVRDSREAAWATLAHFESPAPQCHIELNDWSPATVRSAYRGIFSSLSERLEGPR